MRFNNLFILGIGFVLLAFVYWPTAQVQIHKLAPIETKIITTIPPSDPSCYTSQLNNYLSDYMDRSVKQGIPAAANTNGLRRAFKAKQLLYIQPNIGYVLDSFDFSYAFLTPYAAQVLKEIGAAFNDSLANTPLKGCQLIVTSMTRTQYTVSKLMRRNRTAVSKSPHLNGNAFDFSFSRFQTKQPLNQIERQFLQTKISQILLAFKKNIKIWVTFEPHEECLHVVARKGR